MSSDMFKKYESAIFDDWMAAQAAVEAFMDEHNINPRLLDKLRDLEYEVDEARECWMPIYEDRCELKRRHYWEDADGARYEVWDLIAVFESEEDEDDWLGGFDNWLRWMERDGRFIRRDK